MCIVVPCKVLRVAEGYAEVVYDGAPQRVAVPGMPDLAAGDYITVYAGAALDRIPPDEAEAMLGLLAELAALMEPAE
jgi:hydrogenase assembly chaperone HypC/HupF